MEGIFIFAVMVSLIIALVGISSEKRKMITVEQAQEASLYVVGKANLYNVQDNYCYSTENVVARNSDNNFNNQNGAYMSHPNVHSGMQHNMYHNGMGMRPGNRPNGHFGRPF